MDLESIVVDLLPNGGSYRRLDSDRELVVSSHSNICPSATTQPADVHIAIPSQLADLSPGRQATVLLSSGKPDQVGLPEIINWAESQGQTLVRVAQLVSPAVVVAVLQPNQPERPSRITGELQLERFRNSWLEAENTRLREKAANLRRKLKESRESGGRATTSARRMPRLRRRRQDSR